MGTHSGRKARFAPILVRSLDASRIPAGLGALVASIDALPSSAEIAVDPRSS
jgi:hypothetical protein